MPAFGKRAVFGTFILASRQRWSGQRLMVCTVLLKENIKYFVDMISGAFLLRLRVLQNSFETNFDRKIRSNKSYDFCFHWRSGQSFSTRESVISDFE